MLFQNVSFLMLCALTLVAFWRFPAARLAVLALANGLFYLAAGWQNLLLFLGASLATYALGHRVGGPRGRWVLALGIALNLGNLALFKYAGFATATLHPYVAWLDPAWFKGWLLPIGISFYTFQHIAYLVDRRLKGLAPAPNYLHFWVYISFFGHSVAGPIMRGHEFLPQIARTAQARFDARAFHLGLMLFTAGLIKKVVIADRLALPVDGYFTRAATLSFGEAWAAALLFAFQIYFDFSAYSDMAVGIGRMFGYELPQNFRTPYLAATPSEFWSRWHITLSSWIRDYVYIPLGGNRSGVPRQMLNVFLAMLASGLWHGAAWSFVVWGAYHGALQVAHRAWSLVRERLGWRLFGTLPYRWVAIAAFFGLTVIGWVLFRAPSLEDALSLLGVMARPSGAASADALVRWMPVIAGLYALHVAEAALRRHAPGWVASWVLRVPTPLQGLAYASLAMLVMVASNGSQDFIYFRF